MTVENSVRYYSVMCRKSNVMGLELIYYAGLNYYQWRYMKELNMHFIVQWEQRYDII